MHWHWKFHNRWPNNLACIKIVPKNHELGWFTRLFWLSYFIEPLQKIVLTQYSKNKTNKVNACLSEFHLFSVIAESDTAFFHILYNDSYLCEEWKERHPNMVDDISSKFLQLRFISLEVASLHLNLTNSVQLFIDFCFSFYFFPASSARGLVWLWSIFALLRGTFSGGSSYQI